MRKVKALKREIYDEVVPKKSVEKGKKVKEGGVCQSETTHMSHPRMQMSSQERNDGNTFAILGNLTKVLEDCTKNPQTSPYPKRGSFPTKLNQGSPTPKPIIAS